MRNINRAGWEGAALTETEATKRASSARTILAAISWQHTSTCTQSSSLSSCASTCVVLRLMISIASHHWMAYFLTLSFSPTHTLAFDVGDSQNHFWVLFFSLPRVPVNQVSGFLLPTPTAWRQASLKWVPTLAAQLMSQVCEQIRSSTHNKAPKHYWKLAYMAVPPAALHNITDS